MVYYNIISLEAYFGTPEIAPHHKARRRFLILIPAMNEENVIHIPIDDLNRQKYPSKLFRIYVIADKCHDRTAEIARMHGANVVTEKTNQNIKRHGVGKSNTIDYGLHCIKDWHSFDYLVIIDSDNSVSDNFLQRMNDCAIEFNDPEAIQSSLESKHGHGFINNGLNMSFIRSNFFQQLPESKHGCASLLGTGFASNIKKVIEPINGFRFHTLTEDAYEELSIISSGGNVKFIPDCYVVNENYSRFGQASKGLTRWSRGAFQCFLYFFNWSISHAIINPSYKSFHVLCRTSTLSKMTQLIIIWVAWAWNYIFGVAVSSNIQLLIYPSWFQRIMLLASLIMTFNIVIIENWYLLKPNYGCVKTALLIINAYFFQMFYNIINLYAIVTFWKNKWIVSTHGKEAR